MKSALLSVLVAALMLAPVELYAQHGRGGGGGFGGGGFGGGGYRGGSGGFQGGGAAHMSAARPAAAAPRNFAGGGNVAARNFSNRPAYHGGWYHGDWHGNWGGPWGYHPWGWGWYGGWGAGFGWGLGLGVATVGVGLASPWSWGYYNYYNPYWVQPVGGVSYINYSQPVVVSPQATYGQPNGYAPAGGNYAPSGGNYSPPGGGYAQSSGGPPPQGPAPSPETPAQTEGMALFDNARNLFRQGQYKQALAQTDRAIALLPNDSLMHEFRALCLFAVKDYQQAAAAVYAVVSAGPGWDWTTVSNLYPDVNIYTGQLRALETYCEQDPQADAPRFLLAYHYLLAGHNDQAAGLLREVVKLQPRDQLAAQLLKGLTTPAEEHPAANQPTEPARPVDQASIVGNWKSSRPDGSKFELNLTGDNKFSWKFNQQDKLQQMSGTYTLANNFLILSASDQNSLVGQVAMKPGNKLEFKIAGGNPADPGLTFTR